jgi:hypothetical protein
LSFVGFEGYSQSVTVQGGKSTQLDLKWRNLWQLDEVVVSAGKKPQKNGGSSNSKRYKTKEIEQFSSFNLGN